MKWQSTGVHDSRAGITRRSTTQSGGRRDETTWTAAECEPAACSAGGREEQGCRLVSDGFMSNVGTESIQWWPQTMTATNNDSDSQRHNLVKFIQRCQISLTTLVKKLYTEQKVAVSDHHCYSLWLSLLNLWQSTWSLEAFKYYLLTWPSALESVTWPTGKTRDL